MQKGNDCSGEGTEILSATVDCGAEAHKISGNSIYRMQTDYEPEKLKELPFKPDKNRAVFAFIVDLTQDQLSEGKNKAKVTLTLAGKKKIKFSTTIVTDSSKGRFYHPIPAAFDQAMYETYRGEALERLQARLVELNYLKPEEVTGVCDERTMAACNSLLADNGFPKEEQNDKYLTAKAMGFIESDQVKAREVKDFISTLKGNVRLFNLDIPLWALIAAGAALVALAVLIPLLIIGKKRKSKGQQADETEEPALNSVITSADNMKDQILTIGDEPTMDLSSAGEPEAGAVFGEDEATTELKEPGYILRVRMFYQDVYLDKNLKLMENSQAVIGRGSGATIQTNPEDVSISHRHGVFTAVQGKINYQDESRNGTIFNGQRTIHKGETISIPLNTKVQLEIGAHKILLIAAREN